MDPDLLVEKKHKVVSCPRLDYTEKSENVCFDLSHSKSIIAYPVTITDENSSFSEFRIDNSNYAFIDLGSIELHIQGKLLNLDGTNISPTQASQACITTHFLWSLLKNVEFRLNGKPITQSFAHLSLQNCIVEAFHGAYSKDNTLNYFTRTYFDPEADGGKRVNFEVKNTATGSEPANYTLIKNEVSDSMWRRWELVKHSQLFQVCGPIAPPFLNRTSYLPPGSELDIRIYYNKPAYYLIRSKDSTTEFKYSIKNIEIRAKTLYMFQLAREQLEKKLSNSVLHFSYDYLKESRFLIPAGTDRYLQPRLLDLTHIPAYLIIALLKTRTLDGDFMTDPNLVSIHSLKSIKLFGASLPYDPPEYQLSTNPEEIKDLYNVIAAHIDPDSKAASWLGPAQFLRNSAFVVFRLSPEITTQYNFLAFSGYLGLELVFNSPLVEGFTVIAFSPSRQKFTMNGKDRSVDLL